MQEQLRLSALHAAVEASKVIRDIYQRPFTQQQKPDGSPVTEADLKANALIEDLLLPSGLPFFSEESIQASFDERKHWKSYWLVDPLDGTKEFVSRNGEFTVNIALIDRGVPVLGVIAAPALGLAWSASSDEGVFTHEHIYDQMTTVPLTTYCRDKSSGHHEIRVVISRSHADQTTQATIDILRQAHSDVVCISKGSSLKLCEIALGSADMYPRYAPTHEWDIAAGHALVLASGGKLVDARTGDTISYNKENTLNPPFLAVRRDLPDHIFRQFLL